MTIVEFLLARIADDEAVAWAALDAPGSTWWVNSREQRIVRGAPTTRAPIAEALSWRTAAHIARLDPTRVLAECEAKRKIIEFHKQWPVLVRTEPKLEIGPDDGLTQYAARMAQRLDWLTQQEYAKRFGTEAPTTPMLRAMAAVYADHPDYETAWRPGVS